MPFDPNDPRLTAYALGELEDSETAAVEAILADSYEAQQFVEEVRATARLLREELHAEPSLGLSDEQKHLIDGVLNAPATSPISRNGRARWFGYAVAASVLVGTGVLAVQMTRPKPNAPVEVAVAEVPHSEKDARRAETDASGKQPGDKAFDAQLTWNMPVDAPAAPAPAASEPAAEPFVMMRADRGGLASAAPAQQPSAPMAGMMGMMGMAGRSSGSMGGVGGGVPAMSGQAPEQAAKAKSSEFYAYAPPATRYGRAAADASGQPSKLGANAAQGVALAGKPASPKPTQLSRAAGVQDRRPAREGEALGVEFAEASQGRNNSGLDLYARSPDGRLNEGFETLAKKSKADASASGPLGDELNSLGSVADTKAHAFRGKFNAPAGGSKPEQLAAAAAPVERKRSMALDQVKDLPAAPISGPAPAQEPPVAQQLPTLEDSLSRSTEAATDRFAVAHGEMSVVREQEGVEAKAEVALAIKDAEVRDLKENLSDLDGVAPPAPVVENPGAEEFAPIDENGFERVVDLPQPTLSIDVDTASYANVRRFLNQDQMPPPDAVRIEEMINYFRYDDPEPKGDDPFSVNVEIARCPWNVDHRIARIGLKGKSIDTAHRPVSNLVFLVDVSGSMQDENKLPLLKQSMKMLVETLGENDRVSIVVYAGSEGLALQPTSGERKEVILSALEQLQAGGSTNGGAGITLAYNLATQNFVKGGVNRVILCTDGDFNVGITDRGQLDKLIEEKAKSKVFLSVLGFGQGNLKDATMESLADKGNGNYAYIDSPKEGQKVLVDEAGATLVTIAKDVKVQVEFNPAHVAAYRLIGYENRVMEAKDFNNDQKDAGEIGAGHNVTVLFELVPPGKDVAVAGPPADDLIFQKREPIAADVSKLAMMVKLRYKQPEGDVSKLIQQGVEDTGKDYAAASDDLKFSSSVASFGMLLRGSRFKGSATYDSVLELATASKGEDRSGYRTEFLGLVRKAKELTQPR